MEIVKEFLNKKFEETSSYSYNDLVYDLDDLKQLLLEFGKEVCELQKQECLSNANILRQQYHFDEEMNPIDTITEAIDVQFSNTDYDSSFDQLYKINKDSILNCKNVCHI